MNLSLFQDTPFSSKKKNNPQYAWPTSGNKWSLPNVYKEQHYNKTLKTTY